MATPLAVPMALFGIVLLSYGLWIPWMGLFGNDVPYLWYYHLLGPWGPGDFAAIDRPFSSLFYAASTFALGETVWHYHIFLLLLRWLSAVLLWWVLGLVWPEHKREAALAALLLAAYPGFRQNPVALEFILHFCVLDLFLLSLGASILAMRPGKRYGPWIVVSVAGAAGLFWLEYFIGLEILRPIFLWIVTRRQGLSGRQQWKRILAAWLPAAGVVLAFIIWRVFIFSFPTYKPVLLHELRVSPLVGLVHLGQTAARDVWTALAGAWLQTLHFPSQRLSLLVYLALAFVSLAWVWLLLRRTRQAQSVVAEQDTRYWGETLFAIGLAAMLAGGSIFWLTGIPVTLDFPWDRSTLALMVGACLAITGLLNMILSPRYYPLVAAGLVALAVGMHFVNAQEYRAEWLKLQDFYWQLSWRAPQLKPGTLALFDMIPLNRYSDNDMTAMLNWTYAPDLHSRQIGYKFFDLTLRLDEQHAGLPGLEKDLPVESSQRGVSFHSTTSHTLAISYNPPGCLKIISSENSLLPEITDRLARVLPLSNLDQIHAGGVPARPPAALGPEPAHGWCYYYQKAELARQQGHYQDVAALGDQASSAHLHAADPSELLPFIEGYIATEKLDQAKTLTRAVFRQPTLLPALCQVWNKAGNLVPAMEPSSKAVQKELGCPSPP